MLQKITLLHLRNEEYHQFMTSVDHLLATADWESLNIEQHYPQFKNACNKVTVAIERIHKLDVSQTLSEANTTANRVYRGLVQQLRGKLNCAPVAADQAVAVRIMIYVKHYGNLSMRNLSERNSSFFNFVKDLREHCSDELQRLSLNTVVDQLYTATQRMTELTERRHNLRALIASQRTMKDARKELNTAYISMHERINATLVLSGLLEHKELVEQINERIRFHKGCVAQRKALRKAAKNKAEAKTEAEAVSAVS